MKKVTIEQIAQEVGVSKGLVSRALTGKASVSNDMRNAIIKKAIELGYDFDKLRTKVKRRNVLLIMTSRMMLREEYWQPIIRAIAGTLDEQNINLDYFVYDEGALTDKQLQSLVKADVKGYIFMHNNLDNVLHKVEETNRPIVIVDPRRVSMGHNTRIKYSNHDSVYKLTEFLIGQGHKHLLFYGSKTWSLSFLERCQGFDDCCAMHGDQGVVGYNVLFDNLDGNYSDNDKLQAFLTENPQVTAIVCANDDVAFNAQFVIRRMGKKVPDDYSVTGFDNIERSQYYAPLLTTVNVPRKDIGEAVAEYLTQRINKKSITYSQIIIDCELVIRDSTRKIKEG